MRLVQGLNSLCVVFGASIPSKCNRCLEWTQIVSSVHFWQQSQPECAATAEISVKTADFVRTRQCNFVFHQRIQQRLVDAFWNGKLSIIRMHLPMPKFAIFVLRSLTNSIKNTLLIAELRCWQCTAAGPWGFSALIFSSTHECF